MAIGALGECQGLLEVSSHVTLRAIYCRVFAEQRELGFRVIEILAQDGCRDLLPTGRAVARRAALRERAFMRIGVAIRAFLESQTRITRLVVWTRSMALLASHRSVHACQREASLRVIKLADIQAFPVGVVVALQAVLPEPAFMMILVAGGARLRESQESPAQVFDLDAGTVGLRDMLCSVAAVTSERRVLSFQNVTSQFVIEGLGVPLDEREVFAIVIGMATRALLTGTGFDVVGGMQALMGVDAGTNLRMAVEALESGFSRRQPMTGGAVSGSIE